MTKNCVGLDLSQAERYAESAGSLPSCALRSNLSEPTGCVEFCVEVTRRMRQAVPHFLVEIIDVCGWFPPQILVLADFRTTVISTLRRTMFLMQCLSEAEESLRRVAGRRCKRKATLQHNLERPRPLRVGHSSTPSTATNASTAETCHLVLDQTTRPTAGTEPVRLHTANCGGHRAKRQVSQHQFWTLDTSVRWVEPPWILSVAFLYHLDHVVLP